MTRLHSLAIWCLALLVVLASSVPCTAGTTREEALARHEPRAIERVRKFRERPASDGTLKLVGTTDNVLAEMRELKGVTSLSLICVTGFTDEGVRNLATVRGLQKIVMGSPRFTGEGLRHVGEMPSVESLALKGAVTDLRGLNNFPNLRSLDLGQCTLDDASSQYGL